MTGLMHKDYRTIEDSGKLYFIFIIVFALIPGLTNKAFAMLFSVMIPITTMNYDRNCKWDSYAKIALPQSALTIVGSKYMLGYSMIVLTYVLCTLENIFLSENAPVVVLLTDFVPLMAMAAIYISIILPIMYMVDSNKGGLITIMITLGMILVIAFKQKVAVNFLLSFSAIHMNMFMALIGTMILMNVLSIILSANVFKNKEI